MILVKYEDWYTYIQKASTHVLLSVNMDFLEQTFKNTKQLHHALLIEGEPSTVVPQLYDFFTSVLKMPTKGNPDFYYSEYKTFGINEGRALQNLAAQKAITKRQVFVVTFITMTREAQNAMLKILEEPTRNTHFFLVTSNAEVLLSTLRSRLFIVRAIQKDDTGQRAEQFLAADPKQRLELIKNIIDNKDRSKALALLNQIEITLYQTLTKERTGNTARILQEIGEVKKYLYDRGSSIKMILEHAALIVS